MGVFDRCGSISGRKPNGLLLLCVQYIWPRGDLFLFWREKHPLALMVAANVPLTSHFSEFDRFTPKLIKMFGKNCHIL